MKLVKCHIHFGKIKRTKTTSHESIAIARYGAGLVLSSRESLYIVINYMNWSLIDHLYIIYLREPTNGMVGLDIINGLGICLQLNNITFIWMFHSRAIATL